MSDPLPTESTVTPQISQEPPAGIPPVAPNPQKSQSKKSVSIAIGIAAVALLGGAAFFIASWLNKPIIIREAVNTTQPLIQNLERTNGKMVDHIKKDMDVDSDSIDRYAQEGENYVNSSSSDADTLSDIVSKITSGDLSAYRTALEKYIALSRQLGDIEKENIRIARLFKKPLEEYKEMQIAISGASTYMYSNTVKYQELIDQAVKKEEEIIKTLKDIKPNALFEDGHAVLVKNFENELTLLKKVGTAVKNRSSNDIAEAQKEYAKSAIEVETESNKAEDVFEKMVDDLADDLENEYRKITSQSDTLKRKYNF